MPQFAQFYRSLNAYKAARSAASADVMVVDPSSSEFFKAMRGNAGKQSSREGLSAHAPCITDLLLGALALVAGRARPAALPQPGLWRRVFERASS